MNNPYAKNTSYRKTQVETASPETLILLLYDAAIKFMGQAELAFEDKNIEQINNLLLRIQAIFSELLASLNKEQGGDIAKNLENLYLYFLERLGESNIKKDPKPMLEIRPLVLNLRNTWEEAMQKHKNTTPDIPRPKLNLSA